MDPDNMITCVMVNDPDNSFTELTNPNLHVNRIQVNCYSSNEEAPTSTSPTSTTSSSSSRLFFVDKKNIKLNQNEQFKQSNNISNIKLNNTISNYQQNNVQNIKIVQIANASNLVKNNDTNKLILKTSSPSKSIYNEKLLKKQIYQFKDKQQLRNYSSTSSSSSSICSENKKYILNKKQNLIDKNHLSESELLSSFNYSLNSNCSTTDTLITSNDNELIEQSSDGELMRKNRSIITPKIVNSIQVNCESNTSSFLSSNSSSNLTNNQTNKPNSKFNNCNQIDDTSSNDIQSTDIKNNTNNCQSTSMNQNELYLFSIKRPNELKHYTHEIKFMKTPGFNILTTLIIFTTILMISFLFTIGIYLSVQIFDDPLTERTFEGQMISLNIGQLWNNKFIIDDLKNKFELVFNQSKFSNQLKHIEIINIKKLDNLNNFKSTNQSNQTNLKLLNKQLIEFKIIFNSNEFDLELTASNVYLIISNELIKLNESLFNNYNLDQNSLNIKEIYQDNQLNKTIENLVRLLLNNSTILNSRRLKRLQLIKLSRLNRTNQLDELDYLELYSNQTNEVKEDEFRCENKKLSFCNFLPYNNVMYPNLVNHQNLKELENEFIYFREIIDSECFHFSAEFICLILQPPCVLDTNRILPCGQLCEKFIDSCDKYIPTKLRDKFYSCQQLSKLENSLLLFKNKTTIRQKDDKFSNNKSNDKIDKRIDKKTIESTSNLIFNKEIPKLLTNEYLSEISRKTNNDLTTTVDNLAKDNKEYLDNLAKGNELNKNLDKNQNSSSQLDELNSKFKIKLNNEFKNESNLVSSESNDYNLSVTNNLTNLASVFNKTITNSSSFLDNNNQQLSNCFNIENLEQLNLSVRTLN